MACAFSRAKHKPLPHDVCFLRAKDHALQPRGKPKGTPKSSLGGSNPYFDTSIALGCCPACGISFSADPGARGVSMKAPEVQGDIHVHQVAILQRPRVWDAVTNDLGVWWSGGNGWGARSQASPNIFGRFPFWNPGVHHFETFSELCRGSCKNSHLFGNTSAKTKERWAQSCLLSFKSQGITWDGSFDFGIT